MKLYEVPRNTWIRIKLDDGETMDLLFHRIDGAFSYCTTAAGDVVHLGASTDVEVLNDKPQP